MIRRKQEWALWLMGLLCFCGFPSVYGMGSFYELKRNNIEFHVGPSFPIGSFATPAFGQMDHQAKNLDYNGATLGVSYGLSFDFYVINEYFGIYIAFNGHTYRVKEDNVGQVFSGMDPQTTLGRKAWETKETDGWDEFMALAGVTFRYPMVDCLLVTARAGLGYAHLLSPFYRAQVQDSYMLYTHDFSSNSLPAFGFTVGIGLELLITRGFHLNLRGDYMGSTHIKFNSTGSTVYAENVRISEGKVELQSTTYDFKQAFHAINLSLGLTIAF